MSIEKLLLRTTRCGRCGSPLEFVRCSNCGGNYNRARRGEPDAAIFCTNQNCRNFTRSVLGDLALARSGR